MWVDLCGICASKKWSKPTWITLALRCFHLGALSVFLLSCMQVYMQRSAMLGRIQTLFSKMHANQKTCMYKEKYNALIFIPVASIRGQQSLPRVIPSCYKMQFLIRWVFPAGTPKSSTPMFDSTLVSMPFCKKYYFLQNPVLLFKILTCWSSFR